MLRQSFILLAISGLLFNCQIANAQSTTGSGPPNWQQVSTVWASPVEPALKTTPLAGKPASETAIWVGTPGQPVRLATNTSDFRLTIDFLTTPASEVDLVLPGAQLMQLTGWPASKAPGLWQHATVQYRMSKSAMIEKLIINGVTVAEGHVLTSQPLNGLDAGVVGVQVRKGTAALRQVDYAALNDRAVATWSGPLSYTIYDGENITRAEVVGKKILKQDTAAQINQEVGYGQPRRHSVLFSGKLNALPSGDKPELIRSFVQLPGETHKRTHSLSVGTPAGLHYTLDLNQMALLQVWKGNFADLTDMWYERGESQLLKPMGATVQLPAQTALMVLPNGATESTRPGPTASARTCCTTPG